MADVEMTIQLLETLRDRDMWKEGFMTHEDKPRTRKVICGYAVETIKAQQAEIERLNALMKEQKIEEPQPYPWEHVWDAPDCTFKGRCRNCGFIYYFIQGHDAQYRFCPQCGEQKVI